MPLLLTPAFHFCAVNDGSDCKHLVGQYYGGKSVPSNDVIKLELNKPVTRVIIQAGDRIRATRSFPTLFATRSDNGTDFYFRLPIGYNGDIHQPLETTRIIDTAIITKLQSYLDRGGIRLSSFGAAKTIPVPSDFSMDRHAYEATPFWMSRHGSREFK